ncbi:MAG: SH3 domain-containing protein, partial [Blastochloris sp.]|nr:SH3 domain-containing protein [Blastochloris sp.]
MRRAFLAALAGVLVFALALPALAQQNGVIVNAAILNVRSGPGVGFSVVARVNGGANVLVLGSNADGSWVQVQLAGGISGWVNARYVSVTGGAPSVPVTAPITTNSAVVSTPFLNVRSGPGAGFGDVGTLRQGDVVALIGRIGTNSWVQIQLPNGQTGWVSTRYISSNVPINFRAAVHGSNSGRGSRRDRL